MTQPINDYNKIEVDSDVNEDHNREEQLDNSFEAWYESIGDQVKQKLDLTNVPQANVYDSVVDMDEDPN
ncbi:hypothetical protein [Paenibacillus cremeus]|uniref:DUF4025 domain-containing protein n=1 Tax=Paenibacillus cremeus TaxID=2163881 RepID=A0A559JCH0_9BACL|nr:hypothetical protein [Paenibacillus cremeus]TVX97564.1 hypothetical protein FPZ49_35000 [Paenibacillus cremeus]